MLKAVALSFLTFLTVTAQAQWGGDPYASISGSYQAGGQYFMQPTCAYGDEQHPGFRKVRESEEVKLAKQQLKLAQTDLSKLRKEKDAATRRMSELLSSFQKELNIPIRKFVELADSCQGAYEAVKGTTNNDKADPFCDEVKARFSKGHNEKEIASCNNATRDSFIRGTFLWEGLCGAGSFAKNEAQGSKCFEKANAYQTTRGILEDLKKQIELQEEAVNQAKGELEDAQTLGEEENDDTRTAENEGVRCSDCERARGGGNKIDRLPLYLGTGLGILASTFGYKAAIDANRRNEAIGRPSGPSPYISAISSGYPFFYGGVVGGIMGGMARGSWGCSPMVNSAFGPNGYTGNMNPWGPGVNGSFGVNPMMSMFNPGYFGGPYGYASPYGMSPLGISGGLYANLNPFAMMNGMNGMNPLASLNGGFNPAFNGGFNPMDPYGMMSGGFNPMLNGGFNPLMMNGGFNAGISANLNPFAMMNGMNPFQMNGGFNPFTSGLYNGSFNPMMNGMNGMNGMMNGSFNPYMNGMMNGSFNPYMNGMNGMNPYMNGMNPYMNGMNNMMYPYSNMNGNFYNPSLTAQSAQYAMQDYYSKIQLTYTYQQRIAELNQLMSQIWYGNNSSYGLNGGLNAGINFNLSGGLTTNGILGNTTTTGTRATTGTTFSTP